MRVLEIAGTIEQRTSTPGIYALFRSATEAYLTPTTHNPASDEKATRIRLRVLLLSCARL
jgi:hypothetical protein